MFQALHTLQACTFMKLYVLLLSHFFLLSRHLVQLREQELTIHCIDQYQIGATTPVTQTVHLSNGDVVICMEDSPGTFSLRTKDVKYL